MGIYIADGKLEIHGTEYFDGPKNDSLTVSIWKPAKTESVNENETPVPID